MSIQAVEAVKLSALTGTTRLVAYELATYADKGGGSIFPAVSTVADAIGMTRQTVTAKIKELVDCGALQSVGTSRKGVKRYQFSPAFMNGLLVSNNPTQTVVSNNLTSGVKNSDTERQNILQVVSKNSSPLVSNNPTQTLLTHQLTPQLITANEHGQKLKKSERGETWCDVATVLDVVGSARGREFDTGRVNDFTAQCVRLAGGWLYLRGLSAQQISIELHNARKVLAA